MKKVECYFDSCCEPKNPGGAMGVAAIVIVDGVDVLASSEYYPPHQNNTNNIAEYMGLQKILNFLLDNVLDGEDVSIMGDSQLAIRQMTGEYSIKSGAYVEIAKNCQALISCFSKKPKLIWIPREQNTRADDLSKSHLSKNGVEVATHSDAGNVFNFGKYKGKSVEDVTDLQYLKWFLGNVQKIKPKFREVINKRVSWLEFQNK